MFVLVGGYNRAKPLPQISKNWPYINVEPIKAVPEKTYKINKDFVEYVLKFIEDPIFLTKSYGSYVTLDAISKPLVFSIGLSLKYRRNLFPYPGNNKNTFLIYEKEDRETMNIVQEKYNNKFKEII